MSVIVKSHKGDASQHKCTEGRDTAKSKSKAERTKRGQKTLRSSSLRKGGNIKGVVLRGKEKLGTREPL